MVRQLKLQDRLVAMAAIPILVAAAVAAGLLLFPDGSTTPFAIAAGAGAVVSAAVAFVVIQSVRSSIGGVTRATEQLAEAHRRFAAGEITAADLPQLPIEGEGELVSLASSINAINAVTVEAGETRRSEVREGLSNIVVNLARRSQTLLDRQVEYLDRLESTEEDPDRLGELFKVDHLATRMRRNAESLKVLAEADTGRRRGGPVDVGDVLRVAMGEVENYENIELHEIDEGVVESGTAMDLAHLAAELMENATQFSPPDTPVEVSGSFDPDGQFVISIRDFGMGIPKEKLVDANQVLADPPELGLGMGRSLGFMVVGRLAQRLGATVTLALNGQSGTKATVTVPSSAFKDRETPAPAPVEEKPESTPTVESSSSSASPALEKLLGLTKDQMDESIDQADSPEQTAPPSDWAANSPFSPDGPKPSAELPIRDLEAPTFALEDQPPFSTPEPGLDNNGSDDLSKTATAEQSDEISEEPAIESGLVEDVDEAIDALDDTALDDTAVDDTAVDDRASDNDAVDDTASDNDVSDNDAVDDTVLDNTAVDDTVLDNDVSDNTVSDVTASDDSDVEESWTPPEVTADAPPRIIEPPEKLVDAIPTGQAFDNGVNSLLSGGGLTKRQRGASHVPVGQGRPVAAPSRNPEEIKSMLSRYRDGLKGGKQQLADESTADGVGDSDDQSKDK